METFFDNHSPQSQSSSQHSIINGSLLSKHNFSESSTIKDQVLGGSQGNPLGIVYVNEPVFGIPVAKTEYTPPLVTSNSEIVTCPVGVVPVQFKLTVSPMQNFWPFSRSLISILQGSGSVCWSLEKHIIFSQTLQFTSLTFTFRQK